jgi:hypothetical protein
VYYSGFVASSDGYYTSLLPSDMKMGPIQPLQFRKMVIPSPLLPETYTQIIIPLRTQQGIIGALDIHSSVPGDFSQQDISVFLLLAGCRRE